MTQQRDFFDHFYQLIDHDEWLAGVELYQESLVHSVRQDGDLITGMVNNSGDLECKISIKIHPSWRFIQWVECSCQLNRRYGHYCRHLAAIFLQLRMAKNSLLTSLDTSSSPFPSARPAGRGKRALPPPRMDADGKTAQHEGKADLFTYLRDSIKSASLYGKGPHVKLLLQGDSGAASKEHILNLDDSASFIQLHSGELKTTKALKNLRVFSEPVFSFGTKIYLEGKEKIIAERVLCVAKALIEASLVEEILAGMGEIKPFYQLGENPAENLLQDFLFLPFKSMENRIGTRFIFLPQLGYLPVDRAKVKAGWFDFPYRKEFIDDEAGGLAHRSFSEFASVGEVWLSEDLVSGKPIPQPELADLYLEHGPDSFFYLAPCYRVGNNDISMVELLHLARKEKRRFFKLENSWHQIPDFVVEFPWELDASKGKIKASALELTRFNLIAQESSQKVQEVFSRQDIAQLMHFNPEAVLPPYDTVSLQLRNYQCIGLNWLWWLYQRKLHGLLADEMGLGKTHQAMALISAILKQQAQEPRSGEKKYFLVVCPTTVMAHWQSKLKAFLPDLGALTYYGSGREKDFATFLRDQDVLITSYRLLLHDIKKLQEISWHLVILDEAHYIKNQRTATYKAACTLTSTMRLCLSGTPMENHLGELKNIFDFLVPGYLGSDEYFRKHYLVPIEQHLSVQAEQNLQTMIKPLKLRRTKNNVLTELPAKLEELKYCFLSPEQAKLYRHMIQERAFPLLKQLKDGSERISYLHVFAVLQLLKQICNHPASVLPDADYRKHQSGKFELFKELLGEALDSGNKVVVFSQYLKMIEIINQYCQHQGIQCIAMTGTSKNRGQLIDKFQTDPECKVFISSLLTGGIGIDLTAASTVIHYDRWWNASKEDQASDRVHRIGQKKFVQILKLVTTGTLEEKIAKMIVEKQKLVEKFLGHDSTANSTFSREELILLLQP